MTPVYVGIVARWRGRWVSRVMRHYGDLHVCVYESRPLKSEAAARDYATDVIAALLTQVERLRASKSTI